MNIRFDKNTECRCLCIDYIFNYFNVEACSVEEVRKANNFVKTIQLLTKYNFKVSGYIDKRLLLSLKNLFTVIKHKISIRRDFFGKNATDNYIILYYTSARELYGVNELWTHCICKTFDNNIELGNYDSYFDVIKEQIGSNFKYPDKEDLKNKLIMAIKVWR